MKTTCKTSLLATALLLALPATVLAKDDAAMAGEVRVERQAGPPASATSRDEVRIERHVMRRPVIGVLLTPDAEAGVRISGVTPGSPAAEAGLRSGDRLLSIGGSRILGSDGEHRIRNARKLLRDVEAGKAVRLGYERGGRSATAAVTPRIDERVVVWHGDGDGAEGNRRIIRRVVRPGGDGADAPSPPRGIAPGIHREIVRIGADGSCRGQACDAPRLLGALRWSGLNLASVDAGLGRYFGTDRGVLVLSPGDLEGLQAGDVIHAVEGKAVNTPREIMDTLRGKPGNSRVSVSLLRDHKPATARVTVPRALEALPPLPPPPPAPPAPPKPPTPPKPPKPAPPSAGLEVGAAGGQGRIVLATKTPPAPNMRHG